MKKQHACGMCGHKTDGNGNRVEMEKDFDPNTCELEWCDDCAMDYHAKQEYHHRNIVTREMALDAGDPDLEGQWS